MYSNLQDDRCVLPGYSPPKAASNGEADTYLLVDKAARMTSSEAISNIDGIKALQIQLGNLLFLRGFTLRKLASNEAAIYLKTNEPKLYSQIKK